MLPLRVRLDLGVMAMKGYSILLKSPEMEHYYLMQFSIIPTTSILGWGHTLLLRRQSAYSKPLQQDYSRKQLILENLENLKLSITLQKSYEFVKITNFIVLYLIFISVILYVILYICSQNYFDSDFSECCPHLYCC